MHPSLLARRANRFEVLAKQATSDADILRRRRLLIDIDPRRPAGISSSDAEHEAAIAAARAIRAWLTECGWPAPALCDSGNGAHLIYGVDLPNDDAARSLVQAVLEALALEFDSDAVAVDTAVFNAGRICKLPGTVAKKGDHTSDRPHRLARILDAPAALAPVSAEQLQALAALRPAALTAGSPRAAVAGTCRAAEAGRPGMGGVPRGTAQTIRGTHLPLP